MVKEFYKLVRINKNGEYVFRKATSIDLVMYLPKIIGYGLKISPPLILKRMTLPSKDNWDKLQELDEAK